MTTEKEKKNRDLLRTAKEHRQLIAGVKQRRRRRNKLPNDIGREMTI